MTRLKLLLVLLALGAAAVFATYVWPTKYRYAELRSGGTVMPVRINRFTDATDVFAGKWLVDRPHNPDATNSPAKSAELPADELAKLQLSWEQEPRTPSRINLSIYNGSAYALEDVVVEVAGKAPEPFIPTSEDAKADIEALKRLGIDLHKPVPVPEQLREPRLYRLSQSGRIQTDSLTASAWELDLGFNPKGAAFSIKVAKAAGRRSGLSP